MSDFATVCEDAVRRAGTVLLDRLGKVKFREKARSDLVTEADFAAQEVVRQTLATAFPYHTILGEEDIPGTAAPSGASEYRWIVDPLDGTTNYVHQVPFFSVSLALERQGKLLVGAVYNPVSNECFLATAGQGAFLNGTRLQTSGVTALENAMVSMGFPAMVTPDSPDLRLFNEAVYHCQSMRRTGSAALNLAYVAAGRFDAAWAYATKIWDIAAGVLLIQEAGGVATSFSGNKLRLEHTPIIAAANPALHETLMAMVRKLGIDR